MTIVCKTKLSSGDECGVDAAGRCRECENPFCETHRSTWRPDPKWPGHEVCPACWHKFSDANRSSLQAGRKRQLDVNERLKRAAARLAAKNVPGRVERKTSVVTEGALFWRKEHYTEYAPAWPVRSFDWYYEETQQRGAEERSTETGVTAKGDIVPLRVPHVGEHEVRRAGRGGYFGNHAIPHQRHFEPAELEQIATDLERLF